MTGITRRWLRGSMLLTAAMLVVFVGLFMYFSRQTYYSGVEQAIMSRFSAISGQLKITTASTVAETSQSRSLALRRMVEQFDAKDEFEFMLLDADRLCQTFACHQDTRDECRADCSESHAHHT